MPPIFRYLIYERINYLPILCYLNLLLLCFIISYLLILKKIKNYIIYKWTQQQLK